MLMTKIAQMHADTQTETETERAKERETERPWLVKYMGK